MQKKKKKRNRYITASFVSPSNPKLEANWKVWGNLAKGWPAYSVAILTVTSHLTHDERLMTGLTPVNPNRSRAHALLVSTCAHSTYWLYVDLNANVYAKVRLALVIYSCYRIYLKKNHIYRVYVNVCFVHSAGVECSRHWPLLFASQGRRWWARTSSSPFEFYHMQPVNLSFFCNSLKYLAMHWSW